MPFEDLKLPRKKESGPKKERKSKIGNMKENPRWDTLKSKDKAKIVEEIKGTKTGAILGTSLMLGPLMPLIAPFYLYYRNQGMGREESMNKAFPIAWKVAIVALTFTPLPTTRIIAGAMVALTKPVDKLSETELGKMKELGKKIASDPEMKQQLLMTGVQVGTLAATGQEIDTATMTKMATDMAKKTGEISQKHAIAEGHITEADAKNIKQLATTVQAPSAQPTPTNSLPPK